MHIFRSGKNNPALAPPMVNFTHTGCHKLAGAPVGHGIMHVNYRYLHMYSTHIIHTIYNVFVIVVYCITINNAFITVIVISSAYL